VRGRVVVTDAEERAALGACRGLTSAGYEVCAVSRLSPAATHWSRACVERIRLPDPRESVHAFVDGLSELLRRGQYDALIPGSDASLLAVSEQRDELEPHTRLGLPSCEVVRRSVDKLALLEAASAVGLASPASRSCVDLEGADAAATELGFPVVLKPVQSFAPMNGGLQQRSVSIVADREELAAAVPEFASPFIVQQFEHAQFLSCTGVFADGRLLALTTSRVPRLWPPIAGMHAYSETVTPPDGLPERVRELLGSLEWQGIFQLQLLVLADRLAVIDLNPRVFASILLDADAGANLAAVWVDWLLGRDPAPVTARPAMRYRWEEGELCHFAWQLRRRRIRAAARVLLPHRRVTHAWFRASDPGPLFARGLNLVVGRRAYRRAA
jgi:predicted ATP-grasp superfamily ATP-dependent carboligase